MKSFKKNAILISLIGLLSANVISCNGENKIDKEEFSTIETVNNIKENSEVSIEEETDQEKTKPSVISVPIILATDDTDILDAIDGNLLGVLPAGHNLELLEYIDGGYYKVMYYGKEAYVNADFVVESALYDIKSDIVKMFYALEDKSILIPGDLSESGKVEQKEIEKYECFEVYEELDDSYLVQTADYVGYITKDNLEELNGTFVVIDKSDQELKLYENNEVILDCPVITGKPSTPTREGAFEIYDITHNRYLVGKNNSYKSWVSIMMKFDGNIGLHDAEYHTDEDGRKHGWRETNIFGGNTYITNGSHGCVNMRYDDVMEVSTHIGLGTQVLVKR